MEPPPPQNKLPEKDFIHEEFSQNPYPFWVWLFLAAIISCLLWGGYSWYYSFINKTISTNPFQQVTNRQMSLFLWQFPEYMRVNTANKTAYLPGFQYQEKVSIEPGMADETVIAPPEVLFLYHTWNRLLSRQFIQRPIAVPEFKEFLNYAEEWKPNNWPNAPGDYAKFIKTFPTTSNVENLDNLPLSVIPLEVRQAFQGWKNFFKEGDAINDVSPTYQEMGQFLSQSPHYARNYWRNIVMDKTPKYLISINNEGIDPKTQIPEEELTAFLKTAFYNFQQAQKGK